MHRINWLVCLTLVTPFAVLSGADATATSVDRFIQESTERIERATSLVDRQVVLQDLKLRLEKEVDSADATVAPPTKGPDGGLESSSEAETEAFDAAVAARTRYYLFEPLFQTFLPSQLAVAPWSRDDCQRLTQDLLYNYSIGRPEGARPEGDTMYAIRIIKAFCASP